MINSINRPTQDDVTISHFTKKGKNKVPFLMKIAHFCRLLRQGSTAGQIVVEPSAFVLRPCTIETSAICARTPADLFDRFFNLQQEPPNVGSHHQDS